MTVARPVITVYEGPDRSRTEDVTELPRSLPAACPRRNWPPEAGLTPVRKMVPGSQAERQRRGGSDGGQGRDRSAQDRTHSDQQQPPVPATQQPPQRPLRRRRQPQGGRPGPWTPSTTTPRWSRPRSTPAPLRCRARSAPTVQARPGWPRRHPVQHPVQQRSPGAAPELEPGQLPIHAVGDRARMYQQGAGEALAGGQQGRPGQAERERNQLHQVGRGSQRGQEHRQPGRQRPVDEAADRPVGVLAQRAAQRHPGRPRVLGGVHVLPPAAGGQGDRPQGPYLGQTGHGTGQAVVALGGGLALAMEHLGGEQERSRSPAHPGAYRTRRQPPPPPGLGSPPPRPACRGRGR
jgi:hypothetical protein